jgi:hypothetical protein
MIGNMAIDEADQQHQRLQMVSQSVKRMAPFTSHYFQDANQQDAFMKGIFTLLNTDSHQNIEVLK